MSVNFSLANLGLDFSSLGLGGLNDGLGGSGLGLAAVDLARGVTPAVPDARVVLLTPGGESRVGLGLTAETPCRML